MPPRAPPNSTPSRLYPFRLHWRRLSAPQLTPSTCLLPYFPPPTLSAHYFKQRSWRPLPPELNSSGRRLPPVTRAHRPDSSPAASRPSPHPQSPQTPETFSRQPANADLPTTPAAIIRPPSDNPRCLLSTAGTHPHRRCRTSPQPAAHSRTHRTLQSDRQTRGKGPARVLPQATASSSSSPPAARINRILMHGPLAP